MMVSYARLEKRWWEEPGAIEEEVTKILTGKRSMHVRDILTSHVLILVRAVYLVVQHIVLLRSGNINVMTEVD